MSTLQSDERADHIAKQPRGQTSFNYSQGESSSNGIGPNDAPRNRSSAFGLQHGGSSIPPSPIVNTQNSSPAQLSGLSTEPTTSQAGPSNTSPVSRMQVPPISSIFHTASPVQPGVTVTPTTTRPGTSSKSPFTSPITSPPRNRPNQLLLINPTSTSALTGLLTNTLRPILPSMLELTVYNAPYPAPTAMESMVDSVLSSETVLRDLARYSTNNGETVQNFDALLVATYSKHPLIDALRESYDVPVIGIMEASLYVARMLGDRFGIISTSTRMKVHIDDAVTTYGLSHYLIGVESLHLSALELLNLSSTAAPASSDGQSSPSIASTTSRPREEVHRRLTAQSRALVAKGADTIILGSEFLSSNEVMRIVKDAVRDEDGRRTVNVIDAVEAGITVLNGLVAMGVPTSKKGVFRGEREGRRSRGQTWL